MEAPRPPSGLTEDEATRVFEVLALNGKNALPRACLGSGRSRQRRVSPSHRRRALLASTVVTRRSAIAASLKLTLSMDNPFTGLDLFETEDGLAVGDGLQ